jgi:site-specific recombinase XerD
MSLLSEVEEYLSHLRVERNLSPRTIAGYAHDLGNWLKFTLANYPGVSVEDLTTERIRAYLAETQKTNGAGSLRRHICSLSGLFKFLVENGRIVHNPMLRIRLPKVEKRLPQYLTSEELHSLIDSIPNETWRHKRDTAIVVVLAMTGVRLSELVSLDVQHIQIEPPNGTENYAGSVTVFGKGRKERKIPLNITAIEALRVYLNARPPINTNALFVNNAGNRLAQRNIQKSLTKYAAAAGITRIRVSPHKLRHTCATLMHESDVDIREIQGVLGHSNISSTAIYTHTSSKRLKAAVSTLDEVCNGKH